MSSMSKTQYRKILDQLELTIVGAAPVFGISRRHAQRFASGEAPIPEPMAKLLRLMIKRNISVEEIKKI
jgi:hypothetical protein